jgi:hypothetical protein
MIRLTTSPMELKHTLLIAFPFAVTAVVAFSAA